MAKYNITVVDLYNTTERLVAELEPDERTALDTTLTAMSDAGNIQYHDISDTTEDYVNTFLEALDKIVEIAR